MKDRLTRLYAILSNFSSLENRLLEYLNFLPYTKDTCHVVSPCFIPIILDACSLIDSVLRHLIGESGKRNNFKYLAERSEDTLELADTYSIFLTPEITFLNPFSSWNTKVPDWWNAYNQLKHDRLNQYSNATYENTVSAVCGLHQVVARNHHFIPNLISAGWFDGDNPNLSELIAAQYIHMGVRTFDLIPVETKLFVTPNQSNFVDFSHNQPFVKHDCHFSPRIRSILAAVDCINAGEFMEDQ